MVHHQMLFLSLAGFICAATACPTIAETLKKEPPMGALREGQTVLVDDHTCPPGKIKQITGGNHVKAGGTKHIVRTHRCIPR